MSENALQPLTNRPADDIIALCGGVEVRVDEFIDRAARLSSRLPDVPYVINLCSDRYEYLLGFCAAVIAGQCTLMPPNRQRQTILGIARDYGGAYALGGECIEGIETVPVDDNGGSSAIVEMPQIPDDQLCAIAFTSGSTGEPKPNRKYWKTLRTSTSDTADLILGAPEKTYNFVATVPPQHMWGLEMSVLFPLLTNVAISFRTPFFPPDILAALQELSQPRAIVSSPVHLNALVNANLPGVKLDRIFTATAPMPVDLARRLEESFCAQVIDVFGCSESGIIAAREVTHSTEWQLAKTITLEGRGDSTLIVSDRLEEPVQLNDRVKLLDKGRFVWVGRDEDMVNIAGKRASLAELNRHLNAMPGVEDGVIFMPGPDAKRLAALVVAPGLQRSDILEGLRENIDPAFLPRQVRLVPSLPRQETGKLPRKAVLELFASSRSETNIKAHDS
jgi:acyl-coenzyme A synthetase/AMP-(fatty) acid ligase